MKKIKMPKLKYCEYCYVWCLPDEKYCSWCGKGLMEILKPMNDNPKCVCGEEVWENYRYCTNCGLPREEAVKNLDDIPKEAGVKVEGFKSKAGPRGRHGEDIPRGLDSDDKEKR